ncbi:YidC/Oxa1 family membrane protein insertase [Pseudonocardia hierapolitana]|uniref:Membrane protein insertase YidC n=1 Tax=Pseudonocardia hierapolitana TaxID=1128676 RepID=A0A561SHP1_9PSEU|nr:membrane protein insertase YidC [Pseudonocardia hierapolitana]TWF74398.1 YidC/Oxa1 family membrane protein insertase [Pseudonocardia hierapolitana]
MFDIALFDPLYLAVSGVMWCWHQLFGFLLGPSSGAAWALSVVFLVLTLRALLIRPFLAQVRSARVMRELTPQLAALRTRHADDPARLLQETGALQRAHGVSAASTLLPVLLQVPVFLGLLHVLTSFTNPELANYAFGPDEVRSFLEARLFGVPLSAYLSMPHLDAVGVERWEVAVVTVPLVLLAALATHLTARLSLRQQPADGPLAGIMRWTPWVFPLGVLVGGAFFPFPVAILLYWLTNSAWTLVQQWLVLRPTPRPLQEGHLPATTLQEGGLAAIPAASKPPARVQRRHSSGHRRSRRRR